MELVIQNQTKADAFTGIFQHMKLFTEHITLMCDEDKIYMQCMDKSNVAIVELTLPAEWFDRYENTAGENIRIGFNATFLHRILSSRDKGQQIQLVYSAADTDRIMIHLTSDSDDAAVADSASVSTKKRALPSFAKHFELPLIDIEEEGMSIPPIEYMAEMTMLSSQFSETITQLKMFGDTADFNCSEERIILTSTSQDQGKMFVEIPIDDLSEFSIEEGAHLELSFSLTYLKNMCAYNKLSESVVLKFSDSFPLQIVYPLGGENAQLAFHLAPKIHDD